MSITLADLPVGAKVVDTNTKYYNVPIEWMKLEDNHDGVDTTTLLTEKIICLKAFDAKEPNNSDSNRKNYGNNRYAYSNILSWLNSEKADWYKDMHSKDQAPDSTNVSENAYNNVAGFMNGFSYGFKKLLKTTGKLTAKNTVTDSGGSETIYSKIFLLSETEVGLGNENNIAEGTQYTYFNSADRRKAYATQDCIDNAGTSKPSTVNDPWYWWLRTPTYTRSFTARNVRTDGSLDTISAYGGGHGVRPACSIPSDTLVSDDPDTDGCYILQVESAPQTVGDLPIGSVVVDSETKYYSTPIKWKIIGNGHDGANTVTLLTEDIKALKCFDAKEPNNSNNDRKTYGNNRYAYSNILQWLNKSGSSWYEAKHASDQEPDSANVWQQNSVAVNPYNSEAGFLTGFGDKFLDALQTVSKKTALNTVTDGGGSEDVSSKIFLLSNTEVGLANENSIVEGTKYDYFNDDISRIAYCDQKCIDNSNYASDPTVNDPWRWWLRTPNASNSSSARYIVTNGSLSGDPVYYGYRGVRPACSILADTGVSAAPDSDGVYTLVFNQPVTISPSSYNLGSLTAATNLQLTIVDPGNDTFTGTVTLDSTQIQTITGTGSGTYTIDLSSRWKRLTKQQHTITVSVTEAGGETTTEAYTFTKTNSAPSIVVSSNNLGNQGLGAQVTYTVDDDTENTDSLVVSLDGSTYMTIDGEDIELGVPQQFLLIGPDFDNLADGAHTLLFTVTDDDNVSASQSVAFNKARTDYLRVNDIKKFTVKFFKTWFSNKAALDKLTTDANSKLIYNDVNISDTLTGLENRATALENGYSTIATAVAGMGSTPASNSVSDIVDAIESINTGVDVGLVNFKYTEEYFLNNVLVSSTFDNGLAPKMIGKKVIISNSSQDGDSTMTWTIIGYNHDGTTKTFDLMADRAIKDSVKFGSTQTYSSSTARSTLLGLVSSFSAALQAKMKTMAVASNGNTLNDKIKLLSPYELGLRNSTSSFANEGNIYSNYFTPSTWQNPNDFIADYTAYIRPDSKSVGATGAYYWLRTAYKSNTSNVAYVTAGGAISNSSISQSRALVPVIRLGVIES